MVAHPGLHAAQEGDVIDDLREVGQQFADFRAALSVFLKFPRTGHERGARVGGIVVLDVADKFLSVAFVEFRFGFKQIDLTGAPLHKQGDHGPGTRAGAGGFGKRVVMPAFGIHRFRQQTLLVEYGEGPQPAETEGAALQKMSPGMTAAVHGFSRCIKIRWS